MNYSHLAGLGVLAFCGLATAAPAALKESLTFHASFDGKADADFAKGDARLHTAPKMDARHNGTPGLPASGVVTRAAGKGRWGDALQFHKEGPDIVFFKAPGNVQDSAKAFNGTVSLWLRLSPDEDLAPGYCDPIQITPRAWNDAAFFVEFTKDERPREFRLGAYADFKVWNPQNRPWDQMAFAEKPLVKVERPPFQREKWTQVVFTFSNYNTGKPDGVTRLYLDGALKGELSPREQTFTWDMDKTLVMLGLSYIGLYDELSIFNRALTADEVRALHHLPGGVTALLK